MLTQIVSYIIAYIMCDVAVVYQLHQQPIMLRRLNSAPANQKRNLDPRDHHTSPLMTLNDLEGTI